MKKYILTAAAAVIFSGLVSAQQTAGPVEGGISPEMLARIGETLVEAIKKAGIYEKCLTK